MQAELIAAGVRLNIHLQRAIDSATEVAAKREASGCGRASAEARAGSRKVQISDVQVAAVHLRHVQAEVEHRGTVVVGAHQCCIPISVDRSVVVVSATRGEHQSGAQHQHCPDMLHKTSHFTER